MSAREPNSIDAALLEKWALSYLERYASSAANLRRVLERRAMRRLGAEREQLAAARTSIEELVGRYRAAGLLDDAAYAAGRARRRLARGEPLRRIAAGLAAKGVEAADAASALAALRDGNVDPDLAAACAFARRRRLGPYRPAPADAVARGRELAAFARAGFDRQTAQLVLSCADQAAVAALLDDDPG